MTEKSLNDVLSDNYKYLTENVIKAAEKSCRTAQDITVLAATKTVSAEIINSAIKMGITHIGENRAQELLAKYNDYDLERCKLHFIGRLQTNKVRQIIDKVDMIQSVDSLRLAKEISDQAIKRGMKTDILVEVNVGGEESKGGIVPETALEFIDEIREFKGIGIKGLMTIPPVYETEATARKYFSIIRELFIDISGKKLDNVSMEYLSMGMSDDYALAIEEGSNMVRVGTALFGRRTYI